MSPALTTIITAVHVLLTGADAWVVTLPGTCQALAPAASLPAPQPHRTSRDSPKHTTAFADCGVCAQAVPWPGRLPHCPALLFPSRVHSSSEAGPSPPPAAAPLPEPCEPGAPTRTSPCLRAHVGTAQGQRRPLGSAQPGGGLSKCSPSTDRLDHLAPQCGLCIFGPLLPQNTTDTPGSAHMLTHIPHTRSWCVGQLPPPEIWTHPMHTHNTLPSRHM